MKLRPRLDALEARRKPEARLVIVSTPEGAQLVEKPATVIVTGVPRPPKELAP